MTQGDPNKTATIMAASIPVEAVYLDEEMSPEAEERAMRLLCIGAIRAWLKEKHP